MKKNEFLKKVVFSILFISFFMTNLFSIIYSRIEGIVSDKDTNQSISAAKIWLYVCNSENNSCVGIQEAYTNSDGYFKIDTVSPGQYFLCVKKDGYVKIGSIWTPKIGKDIFEGAITANDKDKFTINEGQIKHFKIGMDVGGALELKVTRKIPNKVESVKLNEFNCTISPNPNDKAEIIFANDFCIETTNSKIIKNLQTGIGINCFFLVRGYPNKNFNVVLEKGKITTIEYILDYTKGQVIHGYVIEKDTGSALKNVELGIGNLLNNEVIFTRTDSNGEYWFGGIASGKYEIFFIINKQSFLKNVEAMASKQIDLNFEV